MRVRSSQTLVLSPQGDELVAFNFLSKSIFSCSPESVRLLQTLDDWHEVNEAIEFLPGTDSGKKQRQITELLDVTALVEEESKQARAETEFLENWDWGIPAALMHFSLKDCAFLEQAEIEDLQRAKSQITPSPRLYCLNDSYRTVQGLPDVLAGNDLLQLMARRRTVRDARQHAISLEQLAECLFAGMGITGQTQNCVCDLPLSMTPSGGARNPFEAYVYARDVSGLEPGFYHYSALEHSLGRLATQLHPPPSELLAGQDWADDKPCVIFLAAFFERPMWKYIDPNAYRGVLIEAGHIGQNIMLAATRHSLSACPTGAFSHTILHQCLELTGSTHCAMYALAIGQLGDETASQKYQ